MKHIAIVAGGDSSEVVVSLKSAQGIKSFIDETKYKTTIVTIIGDEWLAKVSENKSYTIDKNDFSYTVDGEKQKFDFAYITIHGTPGENGILQGYFDLIGLKYSCCGVLAAALSFNKFACNQYLKNFGAKVADSMLVSPGMNVEPKEVVEKLGLPCFIKSNVGGSSFGVTKVKSEADFEKAVEYAFSEGNMIMAEAAITGRELTCAVYDNGKENVALPVIEIISENEFFDYEAKYNGHSREVCPAQISDSLRDQIQEVSKKIYAHLGCAGIVRVDYISSEEGLYFLEGNTIPGMTAASLVPQMVRAAGLDMTNFLTSIIEK